MYFQTKEKKECCGCSACVKACPTQAIQFDIDEEGFRYPIINKDICIDCKLCERICPMAHPKYLNTEKPETYLAMLSDEKQRQRSSSGGLFYAIASWVIRENGIVYGCAMEKDFTVRHIGVDTMDGLEKLRGSKYVQSELENVFVEIGESLKQGRKVYFVGTGCQVAGLKAYLRKDYSNLITSDLICHGVPSQWLFHQHINYLNHKVKGKVLSYQFRDNKHGTGCEIFEYRDIKGNKKIKIKPTYELSPYLYSFMYSYTYRHSCYNCPFARIPRQGDFTLADFWGVKEFFPEIDNSKGCSLLLLNNEKSHDVWNHIKEQCDWHISKIEDAAKYNGNLLHSSSKPSIRDNIYQRIREDGYEKITMTIFRSPREQKIKFVLFLKNHWWCQIIIKTLRPLKNKLFKKQS